VPPVGLVLSDTAVLARAVSAHTEPRSNRMVGCLCSYLLAGFSTPPLPARGMWSGSSRSRFR
jgi:hypothetical protein